MGGGGHCSSADRYFQSLHSHGVGGVGCDIPGLDRHTDHNLSHREHLEEGSESDSIESIYKKLSTPKVSITTNLNLGCPSVIHTTRPSLPSDGDSLLQRTESRPGSRGSSLRGGRPLPSPHDFQ